MITANVIIMLAVTPSIALRTNQNCSFMQTFGRLLELWGGRENWRLQPPSHGASKCRHTSFSDIYFEVLDTLSLIIWFCNCHNNKNHVALFPGSCSLPLCLMKQ